MPLFAAEASGVKERLPKELVTPLKAAKRAAGVTARDTWVCQGDGAGVCITASTKAATEEGDSGQVSTSLGWEHASAGFSSFSVGCQVFPHRPLPRVNLKADKVLSTSSILNSDPPFPPRKGHLYKSQHQKPGRSNQKGPPVPSPRLAGDVLTFMSLEDSSKTTAFLKTCSKICLTQISQAANLGSPHVNFMPLKN